MREEYLIDKLEYRNKLIFLLSTLFILGWIACEFEKQYWDFSNDEFSILIPNDFQLYQNETGKVRTIRKLILRPVRKSLRYKLVVATRLP